MGCAFSAPGVKGEDKKAEVNPTQDAAKEPLPPAGVPEPVKTAAATQCAKTVDSVAAAAEVQPTEQAAVPDNKEEPVAPVLQTPDSENNNAAPEAIAADAAVQDNKGNASEPADAKLAACSACNINSKPADTTPTVEEPGLKSPNNESNGITEANEIVVDKVAELTTVADAPASLATLAQESTQESLQIVTPPPVNVAAQIQALEERASLSPRPASVPSSPRKFATSTKPEAGKPNGTAATNSTPTADKPVAAEAKVIDQQGQTAAPATEVQNMTTSADVAKPTKPVVEQIAASVPVVNGEADHAKAVPAVIQSPITEIPVDAVANKTMTNGTAAGVVQAADVPVVNAQVTDAVSEAVHEVKDSNNAAHVVNTHAAHAVKAAMPTSVNGQVTDFAAKPPIHGAVKKTSSNGGAKPSTAAVHETATGVVPSSNSRTSMSTSNRSSSSGGSFRSGTNSKSNSGRQTVDPAVLATFLPPEPKAKDGKKSVKKSHSKKRK